MNHIDLDLYCCKFYNNDIEIKHTYFLLIPTHKDVTTFRIIFDSNVNPSTETAVSSLCRGKISFRTNHQ